MVLLVLGIVASIAAPRVEQSSQRRRLDAAGRRLDADIAMVREAARSLSGTGTMTFERKGYRWVSSGGSVTGPAGQTLLYDAPYNTVLTDFSAGGDPNIVFDGWGAPDSKLTITLGTPHYRLEYAITDSGPGVLSAMRLATSAERTAEGVK